MKQREIKDYLHLYLGCQCKGDEGTMTYTLATVHKSGQGSILIDEMGNVCAMIPFKLLLRHLSDITKDELKAWAIIAGGDADEKYINKAHESFLKAVQKKGLDAFSVDEGQSHLMFELTRFLISKGFDLFGLIEEGLALDKTKL